MEQCSRCEKELTDIKIKIRLSIDAQRLSDADIWESIPNSQVQPVEKLCRECFNDFTEVIGKAMNV